MRSPTVIERLHELMEKTGTDSIAEVTRNAIALYDLVVEHQEQGGKLIFKHSDGQEETLEVVWR